MRRRRRREDDKSVRVATPQSDRWEYVFMVGGRVLEYSPRWKGILGRLGITQEREREHIRLLGRAFDTVAEVNAYAAAHNWPGWTPMNE